MLKSAMWNAIGSATRSVRLIAAALAIAVMAPMLGGCSSSAKAVAYTVQINPSGAAADQAYDVDMFGVSSDDEFQAWDSNKVAQHFAGGAVAQLRTDRKPVTLHWDAGDAGMKQLSRDDPMWDQWLDRGAWYLVIASNREFLDGATGRRQYAEPIILPLDRRRWSGKLIEIEILNGGMELITRMKPPPAP